MLYQASRAPSNPTVNRTHRHVPSCSRAAGAEATTWRLIVPNMASNRTPRYAASVSQRGVLARR